MWPSALWMLCKEGGTLSRATGFALFSKSKRSAAKNAADEKQRQSFCEGALPLTRIPALAFERRGASDMPNHRHCTPEDREAVSKEQPQRQPQKPRRGRYMHPRAPRYERLEKGENGGAVILAAQGIHTYLRRIACRVDELWCKLDSYLPVQFVFGIHLPTLGCNLPPSLNASGRCTCQDTCVPLL
jgi:hypothetical protein